MFPRRHHLVQRTVFQVAGTVSVPFAKTRVFAQEYGTAECVNSCKYRDGEWFTSKLEPWMGQTADDFVT